MAQDLPPLLCVQRARLLLVCCRVRAARPPHGAHLVAQRPALLPQLRLPDLQEEVVDLAWLGLG